MPPLVTDLEPQGWRVGPHARQRAAELGFDLQELVVAAMHPEQTYPGGPGHSDADARRICQRGDIAVVVSDDSSTIVTALLRTDVQWVHGEHDRRFLAPAVVELPEVPLPKRREKPQKQRVQLNLTDALAMVRQGYSVAQAARLSGYDEVLLQEVLDDD